MNRLSKRPGAERGADIFAGFGGAEGAPVSGGSEAAKPPAIQGPASTLEEPNGSGLGIYEKAGPFALPCITDDKLLILMAQDSVNGRLGLLEAVGKSAGSPTDDEPATVPIAVGGTVAGAIDFAGDSDDLVVTLVAGRSYMISLMGTGAGGLKDPFLEIFDPSLISLGHDDDGGIDRNSVITVTAAVSGTYVIRASAFGSAGGLGVGQYAVDVRQMGADSVPASFAGAVPIAQGITFGFRETATTTGGDDSDYYKISLVAGKYYSFSAAGGTDYESNFYPNDPGEVDTLLVLRGSDGTVLAFNDDISFPSDASSSLLFQATASGDYYLEVTGYSGTGGANVGGYVVDFREIAPPDPLDSIDWANATNIPTVMVDGVRTAYVYFAVAGENFGENARPGDPTQPASGTNGTLVSYGWTAYEKAQFMLAMQEYSKILGIAYVETADSAAATFRVITNSSNAYGAYAYPQDPDYGTQKGIMVFNVDNRGWNLDSADPAVTSDGLGRGGFAFATILHEAGHAHGLAHPHDTGGGSTVMLGVTGSNSLGVFNLNQQVYTQMSYNDGWHTHPDGSVGSGDPSGWRSDAGWAATMGAFDIAVLQARYGVAPAYAAGDTLYSLKDVNGEGTFFETIYDTGGTDTIAYDGARASQIDLNTATLDYSVTGGGIVSFVHNLPGETAAQAIKGGFTIAKGVVIENATGGSGNDVLIGNQAANVLTGNGGNDVLLGGGGADTFIGGTGDDIFHVDESGDLTIENPGEGSDLVRTGLATYVLAQNVENLTATSAIAHDLRGNLGNNLVIANVGNDFIRLQDGGNDTVLGGLGNDVFLFGSTLDGSDVVEGDVGTDQIAIQGDYSGSKALTLGANVGRVENLALLPGNDTRFGDPGTSLYDYSIIVLDAAVAAGIQLIVDAGRLQAGEDFAFNGSAELDGSFFVYGGGGADNLTGGAKNDVFLFGAEGQWGALDVVNGGPGGIDQLALRGNYTLTFGAGQLVGIDQIGLLSAHDTRYGAMGSSYSYDLTMVDSNVAAGAQMTVDGGLLRIAEHFRFDGSAELDGSFRVFGGLVDDVVVGSRNADILQGNAGSDTLTGGEGADVFRYVSASDSTAGASDQILDFAAGSDKIDLSRIDANGNAAGDQAFSWIGSNAFSGTAGQLRAHQDGSSWFVEGDTNGDGVADLVIQLSVTGGPLTQADFLP